MVSNSKCSACMQRSFGSCIGGIERSPKYPEVIVQMKNLPRGMIMVLASSHFPSFWMDGWMLVIYVVMGIVRE